ncbi:DUF4163 domain-containing protein [Sphingobium sp. BYY-5]|uniref:DUF4163 domain-containing protein n=1 Tax=Sphingobium sp. BYY-5 TaxID=2926400 RepID=UPI001FA7B66C|nr:DUF4163 domain-containing protein [Sphingobium sp. BYY-5]MCI4589931.1 DUF4163 domain-containing protein [Sphingobium sp. BYY-5]
MRAKFIQVRGLVPAAAALLVACSPSQDKDGAAGNAAANAAAARFVDRMAGTPPPAPPAPSGHAFEEKDKSDFLEFSYSYPAQAAAVPFLVEKFGKERTSSKADALKMAKDDSASAKRSDYPFRPHSLETQWSVAADTPRFLSLQSQTYVYTGGAHGMTGYDAVLWDKARNRETSVKALMTTPAAFAAAIHDRFCAELDKQRAEKRGEPVVRSDDDFTKCIDPMEQVLVPTSQDGKLIDSMTFVIGPYSAGPYAEGSYEVALPVDTAMRNAIKTEYQDGFVAR